MNQLDFSHPFLGPHDANDDKNLRDYYVQFGDFSALKSKKKFFVVGAKGTGKSAIKEYVRSEREASRDLVVTIDDRYSVPLSQLQTTSAAEIKNKMKGYITSVALQNLLESPEISDQRKKKLKGFQNELVSRILAPIKIKAPFAEYAIKDLFQPEDRTELLKVTDPQLAIDIKAALGDQDLWILIDDIDRIFTSDNERATLNFV